jgi:LacI family transcriptional regulator
MRIRLRDLAEKTGFSMMSVSRALRNKPGVGDRARREIAQAAAQAGYLPNALAGILGKKKPSLTIGVVVPHIENTIFPAMIRAAERKLSGAGYCVFLYCSDNSPIMELDGITALLERQIDGLIWSPAAVDGSLRAARLVRRQGCPLVFLDRIIPGFEADSVTVNDHAGAVAAVSHLVSMGHRAVAHITPEQDSWVARERMRGYFDALEKAGVAPSRGMTVKSSPDIDGGAAAMEILLKRKPLPTAVFCFNDPMAVGAVKTLLRLGMKIPGEMAVAGFSAAVETEISAVPITTVLQDAGGLGEKAAGAVLARIDNPGAGFKSVVLDAPLIIRRSTSPKPGECRA